MKLSYLILVAVGIAIGGGVGLLSAKREHERTLAAREANRLYEERGAAQRRASAAYWKDRVEEDVRHIENRSRPETGARVDELTTAPISSDHASDKRVYVRSYTRRDGTHVPAHHRSAGNETEMDNWGTRGNVNPYTGVSGTRVPSE